MRLTHTISIKKHRIGQVMHNSSKLHLCRCHFFLHIHLCRYIRESHRCCCSRKSQHHTDWHHHTHLCLHYHINTSHIQLIPVQLFSPQSSFVSFTLDRTVIISFTNNCINYYVGSKWQQFLQH